MLLGIEWKLNEGVRETPVELAVKMWLSVEKFVECSQEN